MNADAIKELVKVVRLDWQYHSNPFKIAKPHTDRMKFLLETFLDQYGGHVWGELPDLAIAYDAWLDAWPDSCDGDKFPAVLDEFIPFAEDVVKLLAIGKVTTSLQVANLLLSQEVGDSRRDRCLFNFHYLVEDLKNEHEEALNELDNLQVKEMGR